ncbi:MAG: hypothetical protein ACTSW7_01055 [Candidatus Thorarchaeota archaeon]|nr:MAG: hypothetical protein DRQ25_04870 [Candidatus Fermentibacteria bacterium]HEC72037.1 hypothetical protein [Thermoplasmatales archaeon]
MSEETKREEHLISELHVRNYMLLEFRKLNLHLKRIEHHLERIAIPPATLDYQDPDAVKKATKTISGTRKVSSGQVDQG